jgi:hypothetical protein
MVSSNLEASSLNKSHRKKAQMYWLSELAQLRAGGDERAPDRSVRERGFLQ